MKLNNSFALSVSIAIAASLTATMTQVRAESTTIEQTPVMSAPANVNINNKVGDMTYTRTNLRKMSTKQVLDLEAAGKIKLTKAEKLDLRAKLGAIKGKGTVMCPW